MEKDEFTAWFDQEILWSEEGSYVGFMKCHVQKRFQSDFYVNCKPGHKCKCVPVNDFEISKECLSEKNRNSFPRIKQKVHQIDEWFLFQGTKGVW